MHNEGTCYIDKLKAYQEARLMDCELCFKWFLSCLNERKTWEDRAVTPNKRFVGQSGAEYYDGVDIPESEYPVQRRYCDAFVWDPNPDRLGRVVG